MAFHLSSFGEVVQSPILAEFTYRGVAFVIVLDRGAEPVIVRVEDLLDEEQDVDINWEHLA